MKLNRKKNKSNKKSTEDTIAILEGKNQPIPITNENEIAFLYLQEFYKKKANCDISKLDAGAILNIFNKAVCFTQNVRDQAGKIRENIRNQWAHAVMDEWTETTVDEAFTEMESLSNMLGNNDDISKELKMDKHGIKKAEFELREQLLLINKYRNGVKTGQQTRVKEKIIQLESVHNKEIYIDRDYTPNLEEKNLENLLEKESGKNLENLEEKRTSNLERLFSQEKTVLLKGEAKSLSILGN